MVSPAAESGFQFVTGDVMARVIEPPSRTASEVDPPSLSESGEQLTRANATATTVPIDAMVAETRRRGEDADANTNSPLNVNQMGSELARRKSELIRPK